MTLLRFAPQASDDLVEIWRYIAADSPEPADRVENAVYDACVLIASNGSQKPRVEMAAPTSRSGPISC